MTGHLPLRLRNVNQEFFFYPSVGLSWIIPKSFSMPSLISFGKVRASWSKVGNDIPLFVSNTVGHIAAGGIPQPNDTAPVRYLEAGDEQFF